MTKPTITRTRTFKSEDDAARFIRELRTTAAKYGYSYRDTFIAEPNNPKGGSRWYVRREIADSSFSEPVQETVELGVTFTKPEGDGIMVGATTQDVLLDGRVVGCIECEWIVDYESPCSRKQVRVGTEGYTLTFENGHPLDDCEFVFAVDSNEEYDAEIHYYRVSYPSARKALAAAKRFAKAVL